MVRAIALLLFLSLSASSAVRAQMWSLGGTIDRPLQSLTVTAMPFDFEYDGSGSPRSRFDLSGIGYGATYNRPGFSLSLMGLSGGGDVDTLGSNLFEAALMTWGEYRLTRGSNSGGFRVFIPIVLHSGYRRVSRGDIGFFEEAPDVFSITSLGLGTGIGAGSKLGRQVSWEGRATPIAAVATRSLGEATGSTFLLDADLLLHLGSIAGRFGLSLGYGFRLQRWNVNASDFLSDTPDNYFDYFGRQHTLRAGINW